MAKRKKAQRKKAAKKRRGSTQSTREKPAEGGTRAKVTAARKADFLAAFMDCGRVDLATKAIKIDRTTPYKWAKEDETFAGAWEEARAVAVSMLEDAAFRRAVNGVKKPVYQQGSLVGHVQEYSNTLLIFLLKNWAPEKYMDRVRQEHTGKNGQPLALTWVELAKRANEG